MLLGSFFYPPRRTAAARAKTGFTILEMLVAMAVTVLMLLLLLTLVQSTTNIWQKNTGRAKAFANARMAFESMTRTIGAATLNTYQDYYNASRQTRVSGDLDFRPSIYGRRSDLHFVTGNTLVTGQQGGGIFFTAPFDFDTGSMNPATGGQLNAIGYFVRFSADSSLPSFITNNPARYRLFQLLQPTTELKVMNSNFPGNQWFTSDANASPPKNCFPLAPNIVAFAVLPKLSDRENPSPDSLTGNFTYDTRISWPSGAQPTSMHQLPPVVTVVMVAIDEASALRVAGQSDLGFDPATIFSQTSQLETNLDTISTELSKKNLNFRIFRAEIPIRTAKWSAN